MSSSRNEQQNCSPDCYFQPSWPLLSFDTAAWCTLKGPPSHWVGHYGPTDLTKMANQAVALPGDYSTPIVQLFVCIMQSNKVFCPSSESSPAPLIQSWLRVWILQQAIARILSWPVDHNVRTCRGRCVTATDTSSACRAILAMEQMMAVGVLTTYCRMANILCLFSHDCWRLRRRLRRVSRQDHLTLRLPLHGQAICFYHQRRRMQKAVANPLLVKYRRQTLLQ